MGDVIQLFPESPGDLVEGELIWLPRFASFGTIMTIHRSGKVEIAIQGGTVTLHMLRNRHEIHTAQEAAFVAATNNLA